MPAPKKAKGSNDESELDELGAVPPKGILDDELGLGIEDAIEDAEVEDVETWSDEEEDDSY